MKENEHFPHLFSLHFCCYFSPFEQHKILVKYPENEVKREMVTDGMVIRFMERGEEGERETRSGFEKWLVINCLFEHDLYSWLHLQTSSLPLLPHLFQQLILALHLPSSHTHLLPSNLGLKSLPKKTCKFLHILDSICIPCLLYP